MAKMLHHTPSSKTFYTCLSADIASASSTSIGAKSNFESETTTILYSESTCHPDSETTCQSDLDTTYTAVDIEGQVPSRGLEFLKNKIDNTYSHLKHNEEARPVATSSIASVLSTSNGAKSSFESDTTSALYSESTCHPDSETTCESDLDTTYTAVELESQIPGKTLDFLKNENENAYSHMKHNEDAPPTTIPLITSAIKFCAWFTPYRQLFVVIFIINLAGVISELANHWRWATQHLTSIVVANMLLAIAIRSEWVLRFLYWIAVKTFRPKIFPLWFRVKVVGILYHIGGIHSSSGISALLWLAAASYHHFRDAYKYHASVLGTLSICLACLLLTCATAFPVFRARFHNWFESIHRFLGWLGLLSTTVFFTLESLWDVNEQRWEVESSRVASKTELWLLVTIFVIIFLNWITTTKVPVKIYTASEKASVIRVPGGLTSGLHTRISAGGLREWHIFGSISEGRHAECHYIVAAVQGDFTRMLNTEQPATLFTKRWKPCGLPYFSRLFKRGLAMCTGSGIGAVASTCIQHDNWFLIWIGPDLEKTYGSEILKLICDRIPPERRMIWDTRGSLGRPDVVHLLQVMHQYWKAEVTLFIGSPALNESVLRSSRALKMPVFGSIWDA